MLRGIAISARMGQFQNMSVQARRPHRLSLAQQCAESMKAYITHSGLRPGDRLPTEHEWVEMLGVSRLAVREALQMIAGIGLIDVQQGRGAFVRSIADISVFDQLTFGLDLQQLNYHDVLEARAMLDLTVVELCMLRADPQSLADLGQLLEQMRSAEESGERSEAAHRAFHYRMLHAAGNPLIERVGMMLMDTFWRIGDTIPDLLHVPGNASVHDHYGSHCDLMDAIKSRDLSRSRAAVALHLPIQSDIDPGSLFLPGVGRVEIQPGV